MACSMILSGLRVFDIRDPEHPKEIAYFVAPPDTIAPPAARSSTSARTGRCRSPAFVPERGEIWYSDGTSGFYALKMDPGVWPLAKSCRKAKIRLPRLKGRRIVRAVARRGGKRIAARRGKDLRVLRVPRAKRTTKVRIRLITRNANGERGKRRITRRVKACR